MPPKMMKRKAVKKMVKKGVAEAIAEYEKTRANPDNAGGSGSVNARGIDSPEVQRCTYKTFFNCQPHKFNGTEGVVGLKCWFETIEQVFEISKCAEEDKVKFAVCMFEGRALTWWNENVQNLGLAYNNRFNELALMCSDLVTSEKKKIKCYIRGLPERVKTNVTSSKPISLHDAINMACELVEKAVQGKAAGISKGNKRKWKDHQRNNNNNPNN
ncbi:hypothetical protein Tco_0853034 [Tanacetum coccineum]